VRIAVSGTHCSGKSTLIESFLAVHPEFAHEPEPYEWLAETYGEVHADDFLQQLEICIERLNQYERRACVVFERSPADFVAYLRALGESATEALPLLAAGLRNLDVVVFLPLDASIAVPDDENPELRAAVDEQLAQILLDDELDVVPSTLQIIEARGTLHERLATIEGALKCPT
jgi:hypothetical protein